MTHDVRQTMDDNRQTMDDRQRHKLPTDELKIPVISRVASNFIKRNEILQPNILIYFKAIFNVIQRSMTVR